jgi:hypothetical protein
MMRRWRRALALGAIMALGASPAPTVIPPTGPEAVLRAVVNPSGPASLASAAAFADSLETGIELVRVRIVDRLDAGITLLSEMGITLAEPPVLCLHWIDAAPDDAGLESPCWGTPDPSSEMAALMARDDGTWGLDPANAVAIHAQMTRGGGRCDFPPGDWVFRVRLVPMIDGVTQVPVYVRTPFEVAYDPTEVPTWLPLTETLFCGLASEVVAEQGVPPTFAP